MNPSKNIPSIVFIILALGAASLAAFAYANFQKDLSIMRNSAQEDITLTANKLHIDVMGFREKLAYYIMDSESGNADPEIVTDAFDLVWSRTNLFYRGSLGERLLSYDDKGVIEDLNNTLKESEATIAGIRDASEAELRKVADVFYPYDSALGQFSDKVNLGEEMIQQELRIDLRDRARASLFLSFASVILSVIGLIVLARSNIAITRLADQNLALADEAKAASEAKSKFLTMMSHELRTPMNGVLGLISLAQQKKMSDGQSRLLEQAQRSASHMVSILSDILDYSNISNNQIQLQTRPYFVEDLANSLNDEFQPIAVRQGIEFTTYIDENCPKILMGDFHRLRQSLMHIGRYLIETAGRGDIKLSFLYQEGYLSCQIGFDYRLEGDSWRPAHIVGEKEHIDDNIATDALGPAVGRGLVEGLGGQVGLYEMNGQQSVVVTVPAKAHGNEKMKAVLLTNSSVVEIMIKKYLDHDVFELMSQDAVSEADIVIVDANAGDELQIVKRVREVAPNAQIVGLGKRTDATLFDKTVEMPSQNSEFTRELVGF